MKARNDAYNKEVSRIKEDISKRNTERKKLIEIEAIQKFNYFQKQATQVEAPMMVAIVKQSGLQMEEVLRRQRRKKKFFCDYQESQFSPFWNRNMNNLAKARYPFGQGVPGAKKKGINLMTLKKKGNGKDVD